MKKRKDGRYQISVVVGFDENGKAKRKCVYGKTKKEVEAKAAEIRSLAVKGVMLQEDITIGALAELWLEIEKAPTIKPQSLNTVRSQVRTLNRYLGGIHARGLTAQHIDAVRLQLVEEGKYATFNRLLSNLRAILNFGISRDYVVRNVTAGIKGVKDPQEAVKRALTPFELRAIETADLSPRDRLIVDLLRYTGMRRGELFALRVEDIDLNRHEVTISKNLVASMNIIADETKTPAGMRVIPLPQIFFDRNEAYLRTRKPFEALYRVRGYRPAGAGTTYLIWTRISAAIFGENVPEDFTYHIFRHNYASELYKSGLMKADIKAAQYLLGHDDIKTTLDLYTHFSKEAVDRSYLENFYKNDVKIVSNPHGRAGEMA